MERECSICHIAFQSVQTKQVYCSEKCRNKGNAIKKRLCFNNRPATVKYNLTEQDLNNEEWASIEEFERKYEISNMGRLRVASTKVFVTPHENKIDGYLYCNLSHKRKRKIYKVHRMVALHFILNPEHKKYVDHKFNDKSDNRASQLRWVTFQENISLAWESGAYNNTGSNHGNSILTEENVIEIKTLLSKGIPASKIVNKFNCTISAIYGIKQNRTWNHVKA